MKTPQQQLQSLPSPYNEQALKNFDERFFEHKTDSRFFKTTPSLKVLLSLAFDWDESEQGYDYWFKLAERL